MRPPTFVSRSLTRLLVGGFAAMVLVGAGSLALERARFGGSSDAARARVEEAVSRTVRTLEDGLDRIVETSGALVEDLTLAEQGDATRQKRLFERLSAALSPDSPTISATVFGASTTPIAWAGRPAEVPDSRVMGTDAVFLAPGSLGLRLVRVHPLDDPAAGGRRAGALVIEALFASPAGAGGQDAYELTTDLVDVGVRPRFEGGAERAADEFLVRSRDGTALAAVGITDAALAQARLTFRSRARSVLLAVVAALMLLTSAPLLDWRRVTRSPVTGLVTSTAVALLLVGARLFAGAAIREAGRPGARLLEESSAVTRAFLGSPLEFLASSLLTAGIVALVASGLDLWRVARRGGATVAVDTPSRTGAFVAVHVAAGALVTGLVIGYEAFLRFGVAAVPADILHFGLRPWDWQRLAIVTGLVVLNATVVAAALTVLRGALAPWAVGASPAAVRLLAPVAWLVAPVVAVAAGRVEPWAPVTPTLLALGFVVALAWRLGRLRARLRHASQAARLVASVLGLVLPSLAFYPSLVDAHDRARRAIIEHRFAPEVLDQRRGLQRRLAETLEEIDRLEGLDDLVRAADPEPQGAPPTDAAFLVWSRTTLADERLTSSVELYNAAGALVSRFALKLPDIGGAAAPLESLCQWDVFEEVSPFFSEERRLLHAGRGVCASGPDGRARPVGAVVVHLMLDYGNLSFVSAQSPYAALLGAGRAEPTPPPRAQVNFTVYGWSGTVLYASTPAASPLDETVFERAVSARTPFWTETMQAGRLAQAFVLNDRAGIYVVSAWAETGAGHLLVAAELVALAFLTFLCAVAGGLVYGIVGARTPTSGRALLREVRASFYRKLFLAFVAAAIVPVVALAFVTRAYFASLMFADIELEATRTANVASRVVEDFASLQARGLAALPIIDDNVVVWLSRVIAQDVNIFAGATLLASSERNLFASGLLPTRTPGDIYRAILLDGRPSVVGRESAGGVEYLVAAAPVRVQDQSAVLTVPLTSRQQEIEGQIEELDRRMLLAALLFIMLGAGIGYSMAERIADPVNRLMRATRRIATGDLDARVVATSSDELRRLVEAFNRMADDLRRQRAELERTNRLAAWADMARQVAHEIKNPLTPVQLNAEHLLRVHADRGRPLGTLVDDCVANILSQVRLLRQIAGEFSSFATSPQPRPSPTALAALVRDIVEPYRAGLAARVIFEIAVPDHLPPVLIDPLLIGRALTNVIENALHAMPAGGTLRVTAEPGPGERWATLAVTDTGVGMDAEACARIFEPYFSTKASGTGLGLTIAKRNVESVGGRIAVTSRPGVGTTVALTLPRAS